MSLFPCEPLPTPFTDAHFAAALRELRPSLLYWLSQRGRSVDDSEDLVGEAVLIACHILPEYKPETGQSGLFRWLCGILRCVMLTDRKRADRRPKTAPLEAAANLPAPPPIAQAPADPLAEQIAALPEKLRIVLKGWLDGDTQVEIALRHGLHSNTVANRLKAACRILGQDEPRMTYYTADFDEMCQAATYSKPVGVWRSWRHNHPPERRFVGVSEEREAA